MESEKIGSIISVSILILGSMPTFLDSNEKVYDSVKSPPIFLSGSGSNKVLLYYGNGGPDPWTWGDSVAFYDLQNYYNSTGYPTNYSVIWPMNLKIYKVIFFILPGYKDDTGTYFFTSSQITEIQDFLRNGKRLVVMGDHSGSFGVNTLNELLIDLNIGIIQNADNILSYVTPAATDLYSDQLTENMDALDMDGSGVSSLTLSGTAKSLVKDRVGHDLVAVDQISGSPSRPGADVLVMGDTQVLDDHQLRDGDGDGPYDNFIFADNIVNFNGDGHVLVADAGPDQTVNEGDEVNFDSSASYMVNGTIESYEWDFDSNVDKNGDGNYTNDAEATGPFPTHIYGDNGVYNVTLTVKSPGEEGEYEKIDQDVVFCVDCSGSMAQESVNLSIEGLLIYVDEMSSPDQGAVVVYQSGIAWLMSHLTDDYDRLKDDIEDIPDPEGGTDIAMALQLAINELNRYREPDHFPAIILMTDGQNNLGPEPVIEMANLAAENEFTIYTIALEPSPGFDPPDNETLWEVTNITGGEFYYSPNASYLSIIYAEIAEMVEYSGGLPLQATDTMQVIVKNIVPTIEPLSDLIVNEGDSFNFSASASDPGSDDLTFTWDFEYVSTIVNRYYNDGIMEDPYPSPWGTFPFTANDLVEYIYDDDGFFSITLTVTDDDGGSAISYADVEVLNLAPTITMTIIPSGDEGAPLTFTADAQDPGSDDTSFSWEFEYGPTIENIHYNDGIGPDPFPSPEGVYPFYTSDSVSHAYGDDYNYSLTLTVTDDDGGITTYTTSIGIDNIAPQINEIIIPSIVDEGSLETYTARASDSGSDDITFLWDFEYGPVISNVRYNDGMGPDPDPSPWGTFSFEATDSVDHTYGDDGVYLLTLTISDDDGGVTSYSTNITVNNVAPILEENIIEAVNEEWIRRYKRTENGLDIAHDVIVGPYGNIYVLGDSRGYGTGIDYVIIKYDSDGNELWVARYNGPENSDDHGRDMIVDSSGKIFVTGYTGEEYSNRKNYTTVAFDSNGNQLWAASYDGPTSYQDEAWAITNDSSGNVYVTGYSRGENPYICDIATIAYDSLGNQLWVTRSWLANEAGYAYDIAVDISGNIYVTGSVQGVTPYIDHDYLTIAYNSNGSQLWTKRYNGPGDGYDRAREIDIGPEGNIYVTGRSDGGHPYYTGGTDDDYATIAYDSDGNELWVARYNGPGNEKDFARELVTDNYGNVYVFGFSEGNGTMKDMALIAYDSSGDQLWTARYNGPANNFDADGDLTVDSLGNIYITGWSHNGDNFDYLTAAYNPIGTKLWTARYNSPHDSLDYPNGVAVDNFGNIYVTGKSHVEGDYEMSEEIYDIITIKYSQASRFVCEEGMPISFTYNASDQGTDDLILTWNWGDGTSDTVVEYYNNGTIPEPIYDSLTNEIRSPWGTYPFSVSDTQSHIYGDNGEYTLTLTVEDDDGGISTMTSKVIVNNVAPEITLLEPIIADEGSSFDFIAEARDVGSDDLTFTWEFEMGSTISKIQYNDGISPDPFPSPWGNYPFSTSDSGSGIYGDNGNFSITLTVGDDDGGSVSMTSYIIVNNVAPTIEPFGPYFVDEGTMFDVSTISKDKGSDDLTFTWNLDLGPTHTNIYCNDGLNPDPFPSPDGFFPCSANDSCSMICADDGNYSIVLTVSDDDGGYAVHETYVIVSNLPPSIIVMNSTAVFINEPRTVGYWGHQCEVEEPYGDHTGILQEWIDEISSRSRVFSGISTESEVEDIAQFGDASDMIVMAKRQLMGVWLNLVSGKLHPHSEINMTNLTSSNTVWEAVMEIEEVILTSSDRMELERVKNIADNINNGRGIAKALVDFYATAEDPGADDLTFLWDFGDGKKGKHFYPNIVGAFPTLETDIISHSYFSLGTYTITLTVIDDDGGSVVYEIVITI